VRCRLIGVVGVGDREGEFLVVASLCRGLNLWCSRLFPPLRMLLLLLLLPLVCKTTRGGNSRGQISSGISSNKGTCLRLSLILVLVNILNNNSSTIISTSRRILSVTKICMPLFKLGILVLVLQVLSLLLVVLLLS
jgi:hypothetical protein